MATIKRSTVPSSVESRILTASARRCALCYGLDGDFRRKKGQIAHIDQNPSNSREENLVYLCLEHHDEYDSKTSQAKAITRNELREYKRRLMAAVSKGGHNPSTSSSPQTSSAAPLRSSASALVSGPAAPVEVLSFLSREAAYRVIPKVIRRVNREQRGPKDLLLAALHGHSGDRIDSRKAPIPEFRSFDAALMQCARSVGPDMWKVRELYNITSEERLGEIVRLLRKARKVDGYEVRAFCSPDAIPHLAPLVIGSRDAFLGLEDPRYYRVQGSIHIHGIDAVKLMVEYFNLLWNDRQVTTLRFGTGIDESAVERLRSLILYRNREYTNEALRSGRSANTAARADD